MKSIMSPLKRQLIFGFNINSILFFQVGTAALNSGAMLDLVDACSLLYRLQMEGS